MEGSSCDGFPPKGLFPLASLIILVGLQLNYSTKVSYTSSFKGVQEGIVAVYLVNGGISSEMMVKVLISA